MLKGKFVPHRIQGIAAGMVPAILNKEIIDEMVSVSLEDTVSTMRLLLEHEGLFLGVSSGAYVTASLRVAQDAGKGARIITLSPDFGDGYMEYYEQDVEEDGR